MLEFEWNDKLLYSSISNNLFIAFDVIYFILVLVFKSNNLK